MQRMPYKHIAAHLRKTELACRLHYHQLSHGSNRRKRTNSFASSSTDSISHSPILGAAAPSPHDDTNLRSMSPSNYAYSPPASSCVQLPAASTLLSRSTSNSPIRTLNQPISILPKPLPRRALFETIPNQPLRLDCGTQSSHANVFNVDTDRLRQVYNAHRISFWSVIASEYGSDASPSVLEETWKRTVAYQAPPTPCTSPEAHTTSNGEYTSYQPRPLRRLLTPAQEAKNSATSISSLLGIVGFHSFSRIVMYTDWRCRMPTREVPRRESLSGKWNCKERHVKL